MIKIRDEDEAVNLFLEIIEARVEYWAEMEGNTCKEKCRGLAYSILSILSGGSHEMTKAEVGVLIIKEKRSLHSQYAQKYPNTKTKGKL